MKHLTCKSESKIDEILEEISDYFVGILLKTFLLLRRH